MTEVHLHTRVTQAPDILVSNAADELVMMSLASNVYAALNPTGTRIWRELQQPLIVMELCQRLETEFDVAPKTCQQDVLGLLNEMHAHRFIHVA